MAVNRRDFAHFVTFAASDVRCIKLALIARYYATEQNSRPRLVVLLPFLTLFLSFFPQLFHDASPFQSFIDLVPFHPVNWDVMLLKL